LMFLQRVRAGLSTSSDGVVATTSTVAVLSPYFVHSHTSSHVDMTSPPRRCDDVIRPARVNDVTPTSVGLRASSLTSVYDNVAVTDDVTQQLRSTAADDVVERRDVERTSYRRRDESSTFADSRMRDSNDCDRGAAVRYSQLHRIAILITSDANPGPVLLPMNQSEYRV